MNYWWSCDRRGRDTRGALSAAGFWWHVGGAAMTKQDKPRPHQWARFFCLSVAAAPVACGLLGGAVGAADAAPCVNRSAAHAAQHGTTVAADSRWHVRNGELPTCGVDDGSGRRYIGERDKTAQKPPQRQESVSEWTPRRGGSDSKSRFCRKRWWC